MDSCKAATAQQLLDYVRRLSRNKLLLLTPALPVAEQQSEPVASVQRYLLAWPQPCHGNVTAANGLTFNAADTAQPAHWIATSTISQLSMPISLNVTWSMIEAEEANVAAAAGRAKALSPNVVDSNGTLTAYVKAAWLQ